MIGAILRPAARHRDRGCLRARRHRWEDRRPPSRSTRRGRRTRPGRARNHPDAAV